jgi:hypothetical protein
MSTQYERPWPAIDLAELRFGLAFGSSVEEIADFLRRDVDDVRQKATIEEQRASDVPTGSDARRKIQSSLSAMLSVMARARRRTGSRSPPLAAFKMRSAGNERVTLVWPAGRRDQASCVSPTNAIFYAASNGGVTSTFRLLYPGFDLGR